MLGQLQHRGLSPRLHSTAQSNGHRSTLSGRQRVCIASALSHVRGASAHGRGVAPGLGAPSPSPSRHQRKEVPMVRHQAPLAASTSTGAAAAKPIRTEAASPSPSLPRRSGLARRGKWGGLTLISFMNGVGTILGTAAGGDFPDSPGDSWATARAYREHVERVVARLREDPEAEVQVAEVDGKRRRLRGWTPGDESVRPSVLAAIRRALGLGPLVLSGRRYKDPDLPRGYSLSRTSGLFLQRHIQGHCVTLGSAACCDFPDSPGDGWATALAYREHVERVVARLREDPDAEVQVAEVDAKRRRLRGWTPGDESVRPSVLAAIRRALGLGPLVLSGRRYKNPDLPEGLSRTPGLLMQRQIQGRYVCLGTAAAGDFPDSPQDGYATARAYRQHVERVVARLREDPGAEVQVAEVGKYGRRLRAWAPGDESVRPCVLAAIRRALAT